MDPLVVDPFIAPTLDFHALAPEIVLVVGFVTLILVDVFTDELSKRVTSAIAGLAFLGSMIPILTLYVDGTDRVMFGGAYTVDRYALILKGLFIVTGYVVVLLSTHYIGEGDYWEGEYYTMVLSSVLGMVVMASARDLVTIFIALELLSIPAYMLAAWGKRDLKSGEAGMKYYLMGVFATGVLLYGMSLLYGAAGTTSLSGIAEVMTNGPSELTSLAVVFVIVGFAFKISAVPFHTWAPDTYDGAPMPVTAFLAVASKAAGFVALMNVVFIAFPTQPDVIQWVFFPLAIATMTVGNLIALRQTNIIRMLAYSGIAQAGYMLAPFAVSGMVSDPNEAMRAVVIYLIIYAAMNLGAFAVVIAVARRTGSTEIDSLKGMFQYAPGMVLALSVFLAGFAGVPPAGGWFGKFVIFRSTIDNGSTIGYILAASIAINSVVAAFYYIRVIFTMISVDPDEIAHKPFKVPAALKGAIAITIVVTLVAGLYPALISNITDTATLVASAFP